MKTAGVVLWPSLFDGTSEFVAQLESQDGFSVGAVTGRNKAFHTERLSQTYTRSTYLYIVPVLGLSLIYRLICHFCFKKNLCDSFDWKPYIICDKIQWFFFLSLYCCVRDGPDKKDDFPDI